MLGSIRVCWWCCVFVGCTTLGSCASPPRGFDSPVPTSRAAAIADAAAARDEAALPALVSLLESEDAVVRMLAHRALRDLTGEDLGYDFAGGDADRREAAQRWRAWLEARTSSPERTGGRLGAPPADADKSMSRRSRATLVAQAGPITKAHWRAGEAMDTHRP